jgi:hypothetical protein
MIIQVQTTRTLYETDFNRWVEETVKQLQEQDFTAIDLENLIEEVADLSGRERDKLESLLMNILEHLLKLAYWESERDYNQKHWKAEIFNFRKQLKKTLKKSPSLKPYLLEIFAETYKDACRSTALRSGLPLSNFPVNPIGTPEQILDDDWYPLEQS